MGKNKVGHAAQAPWALGCGRWALGVRHWESFSSCAAHVQRRAPNRKVRYPFMFLIAWGISIFMYSLFHSLLPQITRSHRESTVRWLARWSARWLACSSRPFSTVSVDQTDVRHFTCLVLPRRHVPHHAECCQCRSVHSTPCNSPAIHGVITQGVNITHTARRKVNPPSKRRAPDIPLPQLSAPTCTHRWSLPRW